MKSCSLKKSADTVLFCCLTFLCEPLIGQDGGPEIETVPSTLRDISIEEVKNKAEAGNPEAMATYGAALATGAFGLKQSQNESIRWFKMAAEKGSVDGASGLGWAYFNGEGIEQDYKEAAKWFLIAAEKGNPVAQERMGYLYYEGKGVPQESGVAFGWYKKSAEQGNEGGICGVAMCYLFGKGVEKNDQEALVWFKKAADRGDPIGKQFYELVKSQQK